MSTFPLYSERTARLTKNRINFLKPARKAARIADSKKGEDIRILNVKKSSSFADYFLIVTADSTPQINAVSENIKKELEENFGLVPIHREGKYSHSWAVIDYGGLVIHIMSSKTRNFYRIENLWYKARKIRF